MEKKNKYFIQDGMISKFDFMDNQEFYPLTTLCNMLNENDEKYDKLAKKFVIVSKALDLMKKYAEEIIYDLEYCGGRTDSDMPSSVYFIEQAKEMVENE